MTPSALRGRQASYIRAPLSIPFTISPNNLISPLRTLLLSGRETRRCLRSPSTRRARRTGLDSPGVGNQQFNAVICCCLSDDGNPWFMPAPSAIHPSLRQLIRRRTIRRVTDERRARLVSASRYNRRRLAGSVPAASRLADFQIKAKTMCEGAGTFLWVFELIFSSFTVILEAIFLQKLAHWQN